MSTHSSQDFELDDLDESDLKELADDLYLDDVGEWIEDVEDYGSESDNDDFLNQNPRTPQRQNRVIRRGRGRRGAVNTRFPHRGGRGRGATGRRNFNDPVHRQFSNEKVGNSRDEGWRRKGSMRQEDNRDPRRGKEYDVKRREGRFSANRNSGSTINEIPGLDFMETYSDDKNKRQYGQENQRERTKRQDHSPEPSRSSYSDKMSLSPSNSSKRHSLERTGSSSSYYNSESRTTRRYKSEYESRRHKSRSVSPRSPRNDDFNADRSPESQLYGNNRRSSPERYVRRSDISPRRSVSVSPERKRMSSPPPPQPSTTNLASMKEWYPEMEQPFVNQPSSSNYQNHPQMSNMPPGYSGSGQYDETSAVPVSYGGPEYSNYPEYHNPPPSYPGYDVGSTSTAYFITQPPPPLQNTAAPVPPYMPPQEYPRPDLCQQDVRWPVHPDTSVTFGSQRQPQPPEQRHSTRMSLVAVHTSSEQFQNTNSSNCPPEVSVEDQKKKAIENELKQQRRSLAKQREEYYSKSRTMRKELELLEDQKKELLADKLPGNEKILKENQKLQFYLKNVYAWEKKTISKKNTEIQNKLKAIVNVTEMLSTIIGDDKDLIEELVGEKKDKKAEEARKSSERSSPAYNRDIRSVPSPSFITTHEQKKNKHHISESRNLEEHIIHESNNKSVKARYNYVHYDPEMHWCRVCNVFPKTAKEYLNHLHTAKHKSATLEKRLVDMPWHKNQTIEETPHYEGAPMKRLPIRGLQFFISATAWYCKLCSVWIGDLHCASVHLKSTLHSDNYAALIQQQPHWEVDWLADRTRAYEKAAENQQNDGKAVKIDNKGALEITKSLNEQLVAVFKEKNKQNRRSKQRQNKSSDSSSSDSSSSSSSSSDNRSRHKEDETIDRAQSIRVAMRNKDVPPTKGGKSDSYDRKKYSSSDKESFKDSRSSTDDRILQEWMEFSNIDKDRDMINNLKDRLKRKQAVEHEIVDRKKPYEKRRSSKEDHRRCDEKPPRDDHKKYDDRKKSYDDVRKKHSGKYDVDKRHGNKRNEKLPDRRSDKGKNEKAYSKGDGNKVDHKQLESDKKSLAKPGTLSSIAKQIKKPVPEDNDSDNNESSLEKLTAESAAKKKDNKKSGVQPLKTKLPFIGRMPFIGKIPTIKKKNEGDNSTKKNKQDNTSDSSKQGLIWPEIPIRVDEPISEQVQDNPVKSTAETSTLRSKDATKSGKTINFSPIIGSTAPVNKSVSSTAAAPVVTTTVSVSSDNSVATTTTSSNKNDSNKEEGLPRSTLVLSKTPGVTAKSAVKLKKLTKKVFDDGIAGGVEDMDIEVEEDELAEDNLPKDFQDALDILFPTDPPPAENLSTENQALTDLNSSVQNNSPVNIPQPQGNVMQNAEIVGNPMNNEPGQRNMLLMGPMPGLVHQYNVPSMGPMGAPGPMNTNNMPPGHMKPPMLGPPNMQMGPEGPNGNQMNCRPDFNMMPNRMRQCLVGPGPDHGPGHMNHHQMGGPEMMMPPRGPRVPMHPRMMGPGQRPPMGPGQRPPMGPGQRPPMGLRMPMRPPGPPHPDARPGGIRPQGMMPPPPFEDEESGAENDCGRGGFVFKRKNPPSQKKRQQLKKRRDMLEAREKELNEKIVELQGKVVANDEATKDAEPTNTDNKKDDSKKMELALLGIDEDDICCT